MSKKSTIYFGQPLIDLTAAISPSDSVSGRINRAIERYLYILNHSVNGLDGQEMALIRDILPNKAGIMDILRLPDKIHCHNQAFAAMLETMPASDIITIVERIESSRYE